MPMLFGDETLYRALGQRLKALRRARRLTQTDVAGVLGCTRVGYTMVETGRQRLRVDQLDRLATFFAVSTDVLLGRSPAAARKPVPCATCAAGERRVRALTDRLRRVRVDALKAEAAAQRINYALRGALRARGGDDGAG